MPLVKVSNQTLRHQVSTKLLAIFMLLFGLCDGLDSLVVAEMYNAFTEYTFRSEVGFLLSGKTNAQCPASWHNLRRSQRVLGARVVQSGFTLLGPHQLSPCAEGPDC